jgi:hypothetical protein
MGRWSFYDSRFEVSLKKDFFMNIYLRDELFLMGYVGVCGLGGIFECEAYK